MIKCVAIDDEPIALSIIEEYCKRYGDIELSTFTSPVDGMRCIEETKPDLVFMDIKMSTHNGLELARTLPADICLIFTTAFSQYALDGFNVDAVDFLHKPIFYPRFERAMEKARKWIGHRDMPEANASLTLKVEHKNVVIKFSDILYIEAMDNYVKLYRRNMPMILSHITMKEMENKLPAEGFARVHRSFIVALNAIEKFSNLRIHLESVQQPIPVGRKYTESFNSLYNK